MRKIISLLMIALSIFFAMPELFALNPPNSTPTGPSNKEEPDENPCDKDPTLPECSKNPCDEDPSLPECQKSCDEDPCQAHCNTPCQKCCDDKNNSNNSCKTSCSIDMAIPFGRILHRDSVSSLLTVHRDKASSSLFSPQSLEYSLPEASTIAHVQTEDLPDGISREVAIQRSNGEYVYYTFKTGESIGYPSGDTIRFTSKLVMLDANGNQVTDNPIFYDRVLSTATKMRYSAASKTIIYIENPNGTKVDISNSDYGMDIIRDDCDYLRQIWSMADGLCDIVVIDEYKYEIRLYTPENAGSKNTSTGLYVPTGSPHSVWTIENPLRSDMNFDNVKITELASGSSYVYDWHYNESLDQWTVTAGAGARVSSMSKLWNTARTTMNFVQEIKDSSGILTYRRYGVTTKKTWGDVTTEEHVGNDSSPLTSIYYTYYEDVTQTGKYGRLKSTTKDSYWTSCDYDSEGRKTYAAEVWLDAASGSNVNQVKTYYYSYTPVDPEDILEFNDQRFRTVDVKIQNITVQKTYYAYKTNAAGEKVEITEEAASPNAAYGASGNMRTVVTYYAETAGDKLDGRVKCIVKPDGTIENYTYEYGIYTINADPAACSFTAGTGYAMRKTVTHGTISSPDGIAGKTLRKVTVADEFGNNVLEEDYVYTGSGYERVTWTVNNFNTQHHVITSYSSNNTATAATWNCCSKASETTADGIEYVYTYDLLKRMSTKTKKGHNGTADIVTAYTYDSNGRILSETVSAGGLSLSGAKTYDLLGRVLSETDASGLTTTYVYSSDGKTITKTRPGGFTEIVEKYADGQIKSVTGTAVIAKYYEYGVNSDGTCWTKIYAGTLGSPRWAKTTFDMLNRKIKEEQPGYNGSTIATQYFYNDKGQLVKASKTGVADTLYAYDEVGNQIRACLDVNANDIIDLASMDRITEQETTIVSEDNAWWQKSVSKVYALDNDATATITGITKNQLTSLQAGTVSKQISVDIHGNITTSTTTLDKMNKTITSITDVPDSTIDEQTISVNGLMTSSRSKTNLIRTYLYDHLERQIGIIAPRIENSTTAYYASGIGKVGKVYTFTDAAGNISTYDYDSSSGRLFSVENAHGKKSYYAYNMRGQLTRQWGETEYPIEKTYDDYAQLTQLKTFRGGSGWNNSTWPADAGAADTTSWAYQEATGLLTAKTFADGKSVGYTYTNDGKLATRAWSRLNSGSPLLTSYSYDANTAEMTAIDYADSTPDVAFTYDRLGRTKTVSDAVGSRTFSYNNSLQLASETITGLYNKTIARNYDMIGRYNGINIGTEYDLDYGYDGYGRFNSLTNGSDLYTYVYLANSNLISTLTGPNNITKTNTYEAHRNLITSLENKYSTTTVSQYLYRYDAIARRTDTVHTGTAFAQANFNKWLYNDRSELVDGKKYAGTDSNDTSDPLTTFDYTFSFDNIGNRITSTNSGTSTSYTSNNRNQYTAVGAEAPLYDDDGNMLSHGDWAYTWNAENRLVSAEKSNQKLEFTYDYMGRRVEKKVYSGSTGTWTLDKHLCFVYDSYKLIEELDGVNSNALLRKYAWSGEELLAVYDGGNTTTYYYFTDTNKNISQLIDNSGNIVAAYEYSPFGQITSKTGAYSDVNPFRFSSEYFDAETNLVYYNYRYHSPALGRWIKRDPIEENGGYNLYTLLHNDSVNKIDFLGREECCDGNGNIIPQVTDDAGEQCCPDKIQTVELRMDSPKSSVLEQVYEALKKGYSMKDIISANGVNIDSGHTFIHSEGKGTGFYPPPGRGWSGEGHFEDNTEHVYDSYIPYKACPQTLSKMNKEIQKDQDKPPYYDLLGNDPKNNIYQCTTWATKTLKNTGFKNVPNALEPYGLAREKGAIAAPKKSE